MCVSWICAKSFFYRSYIYTHIHEQIHTYMGMCEKIHYRSAHTCVYLYVYMCTHACKRMHVRTHACICLFMWIYVTRMHEATFITHMDVWYLLHTYAHTCMHLSVCVYIHTCTSNNLRTQSVQEHDQSAPWASLVVPSPARMYVCMYVCMYICEPNQCNNMTRVPREFL
jgi:hypothetical protein